MSRSEGALMRSKERFDGAINFLFVSQSNSPQTVSHEQPRLDLTDLLI